MERCGRDLELDALDCDIFSQLRDRMMSNVPRFIRSLAGAKRSVVFTDGACEGPSDEPVITIGAVLYHFDGSQWHTVWFNGVVPNSLRAEWIQTGKRHLIGPTELYAVVAARAMWDEWLAGIRSLFFVDHNGVLASCVKGSSRDAVWRRLLLCLERHDAGVPCDAWWGRVPSPSNPADAPSRGSSAFPILGTCTRVDCVCPLTGLLLHSVDPGVS